MKIAEKYFDGLKDAYCSRGGIDEWRPFERAIRGISDENKSELMKVFPDIPESLIDLLRRVDGTYWRKYLKGEVAFYILASDVDDGEYPYYLYSSQQMIDQKHVSYNDDFADLIGSYLEDMENERGLFVDEKIRIDGAPLLWLCFSDCMNNGSVSSLYIDFTPSDKGVKGQIIRYLQDPEELRVIADSFDEYLEKIIEKEYAFIREEDF